MHYSLNLFVGWMSFLYGAASGSLMGLFFHQEDWLGGYQSFPRRMLRLGHVAFFGLGLINILFALSGDAVTPTQWVSIASILLAVGAVTMPLTCFLTAWEKSCRHLFVIPAGSTLGGILGLLVSLTVG